jgi:hypothetical protein
MRLQNMYGPGLRKFIATARAKPARRDGRVDAEAVEGCFVSAGEAGAPGAVSAAARRSVSGAAVVVAVGPRREARRERRLSVARKSRRTPPATLSAEIVHGGSCDTTSRMSVTMGISATSGARLNGSVARAPRRSV